MARIPTGNFGNAVAQAPQRVNVPAGAFDTGGQGLQRTGEIMMGLADDAMQKQKQEDAALERARAANIVLDREIAVDGIGKDIEQQIAEGKLPYAEAQSVYKQRIGELERPGTKHLDPVTAENLTKGMKRAEYRGESYIGSVVGKAKHADMRIQTDGLLDKLGKQAGLPGADMSKLQAQADAMDEIGLQSYGAAWGKRKQDWIDNTWSAQLTQQAMSVRNDMAGITALEKRITEGDYADKLDSNRRNSLVATLAGYKTSLLQRQEAAAARAQREQERQLKNAEAEFNTFQAMADKGTMLAPEYIDRAIKMTAGTPYQQGIKALAVQARETGGLAAQPVMAQQAMLDQVDSLIAKQGRTPALDKRREQIAKVLQASQSDLKSDPLRAGLNRGVVTELAPIDISSPKAITETLGKRLEQSETVGMWAGRQVSPFLQEEAQQVSRILREAKPEQQRSLLVGIKSATPSMSTFKAIMQQIAPDNPVVANAGVFAARGLSDGNNRAVADMILRGNALLRPDTKEDGKPAGGKLLPMPKEDALLREFGSYEGNAYAGKEQARNVAYQTAKAIYAAKASEEGDYSGELVGKRWKESIKMATGNIESWNGSKVVLPYSMDRGAFKDGLKSKAAELVKSGRLDPDISMGKLYDMPLENAGDGRYFFRSGDGYLVGKDGKPVIIDFNEAGK